jgi:hypothetical protein
MKSAERPPKRPPQPARAREDHAPGLAVYWYDYRSPGAAPAFFAGGRYHFSDRVTLTMRVGYPSFTAGVSVLF